MSDAAAKTTRFQELVNSATEGPEEAGYDHEPEYMWRGQRFRIVTMRQAPLMQFRVWVSPQEKLPIKYAYVTHQRDTQQNDRGLNEIEMVIRDCMRICVAGYNLAELEDALMLQRVSEIQSVSELQAESALKQQGNTPVITDISVEYGRFDMENRRWMRGSGFWCPRERKWVPQVPDSS